MNLPPDPTVEDVLLWLLEVPEDPDQQIDMSLALRDLERALNDPDDPYGALDLILAQALLMMACDASARQITGWLEDCGLPHRRRTWRQRVRSRLRR